MQQYQHMIGKLLANRYLIISIIGVGGMAVVFNAYDKVSGDTVALKMLCEENEDKDALPTLRKQFINEARAMSKLSHAGVVKLFDASLKQSPLYFVMEFVDGITLKEYISRKKCLTQYEVVDFSLQILSALSHIHSKGIVHCDIKPHNILLTRSGKLKITDFGISRMPGIIPDIPEDKAVGTVYYVSPEQAEGKVLDHRSDLYSLGIMMYQMASGKLPFVSNDIDKVARMQSYAPPKRPRAINPEISKGLEQIILKSIAKKTYMRFTDADEMRHYLELLKRNPAAVFRLQEKSYEPKSEHPPIKYHSHNAYATLLGVCAAFIISLSVSIFALNYEPNKAIGGSSMIADVTSLSPNEADEILEEQGYKVKFENLYSDTVAAGLACKTSPEANSKVKRGSEITVYISLGPDIIFVTPGDFTGNHEREVLVRLNELGLTVGEVSYVSSELPKGTVISQSVDADKNIPKGTAIDFVVSGG